MTASVRILTTSTMDSSPAILLINTDGSKILINCGEGCQRCFLEHSQKLATVQTVCLTDLRYDTIGGLPGMILTVSDSAAASAMEAAASVAKKNAKESTLQQRSSSNANSNTNSKQTEQQELPGLSIMGPTGTNNFLHSLRHFMRREKFKLHVEQGANKTVEPPQRSKRRRKFKTTEPFESNSFSIHSISMPKESGIGVLGDGDDEPSRKRPRPIDGTSPTDQEGQQRESAPHRERLSFLFTSPPIHGKFLPAKAAALGVPKGPLYAKLKSGKAVQFVDKDGVEQTIESHQVVTPPSPGVAVLVLNYQELSDVISSGGEDDKVDLFFTNLREMLKAKNVQLDLVVHLMRTSKEYPTKASFWERQLGTSEVEHIYLPTQPESDSDCTPYRSAAMGALSRSLLCPSIYRAPCFPQSTATESTPPDNLIITGRSMMDYMLIPRLRKGFGQTSLPAVQEAAKEATQTALDLGAVDLAQQILRVDGADLAAPSFEGELLFTGTGSALPCKHRNVTGMSLTMKNGNSMLLDIGEGTVGQILRAQDAHDRNSLTSAATKLAKIRAVWISHPHADHHLGILRLLTERQSSEPLILLAPTSLFRFLREYQDVDPTIRDSYIAIDCKDLVGENPAAVAKLQEALGVTACRAVPVAHCAHSYAVVLDGTCFGRLVYSGDCRPSQQLAAIGKGADVVIHEATFEDGMEAEAALKRHSTVGEALGIAHKMEAKCVVLTHFSQRYPKIPPTPAKQLSDIPVVFAFDYMSLTPRTLTAASKLTPALRLLYPEEEDVSDDAKKDASIAQQAMSVPGLFAVKGIL